MYMHKGKTKHHCKNLSDHDEHAYEDEKKELGAKSLRWGRSEDMLAFHAWIYIVHHKA